MGSRKGTIVASAVALVVLSANRAKADEAPATDCAFDRAAMLALAPEKFDQDLNGGWRTVAAKAQCAVAAADLLADYRRAHWGSLRSGQLHINYWHEGQMRALAGQTDRAVPLLMAGVDPQSTYGFADYALGTVAFLNRDLPALKGARARLAAQPKPADWAESTAQFRAKFNADLAWPPNLDVLDGLIRCFDKPYRDAYGPGCRPGPQRP